MRSGKEKRKDEAEAMTAREGSGETKEGFCVGL